MAKEIVDGRFVVLDEIGKGGMGIVLRVLDQDEVEEVALKYCPSDEEIIIKRFRREVRIMETIEHPNVMPILHSNLKHAPPYFVMPLATCIATEIAEGLSENKALEVFESFCVGVQAIHNASGTHRDIKPDNAMRLGDGRVVVADMGLAKLEPRDTTTLTQATAFLGTRMYCAPEQLLEDGSRQADVRTDVFQLGKMLYELVTGDRPALIDSTKLPAGLAYIVDRATKQHPNERYQTVGELLDAVHNYVRSQAPNASTASEFEGALQECETLAKEGKYRSPNLKKLLALIPQLVDDKGFLLEQFHRVSSATFETMATKFPLELIGALEVYVEAVESEVGGYNFSYAETVARFMKVIFFASDEPRMRMLTLRATMIAAVKLNRFAAMEEFDKMLVAVQEKHQAALIAQMLLADRSYYVGLADRIPRSKLHPAIRAVAEQIAERPKG